MTYSDEVKLLPCPTPWCQVPSPYLQTKGDIFRVFCTSCGVATDLFRARYEAIEQWSTRPPVVTDEVVERDRLAPGPWEATFALVKAADEAAAWIKRVRVNAEAEGTWTSLPFERGKPPGKSGVRQMNNLRAAIRKARAAIAVVSGGERVSGAASTASIGRGNAMIATAKIRCRRAGNHDPRD